MIRTRRVTELPDHRLFTAFAQGEMIGPWVTWPIFRANSLGMWEVREDGRFLGLFGVYHASMVSGSNFWFAAGYGLPQTSLHGWRLLRRVARRLARRLGRVTAVVQEGYDKGDRLVRFFGFKQSGQVGNLRVYQWQPE